MGPPPLALGATFAGLVLTLAVGLILARRLAERPFGMQFAGFCLPLLLFAVGWISAAFLVEAPWHPWIAARLTPSAALLEGYDLYCARGGGPLNGWIYPPVFALFFAPVMWIPDLTTSIYAGALLSTASLLVPVFVLLRRAGCRGLSGTVLFALAWTCIAIATPTRNMMAGLHVDALAAGLGLLSCSFLVRPGTVLSRGPLFAAAWLAVLSGWTKQVEAPLLFAQIAYLGLLQGRRSVKVYLLHASLATLATGGLFALWFGVREMFFNVLQVPMKHPYVSFPPVLREMAFLFAPWVALFFALGFLVRRRGGPGLLRDHALTLLLLASLFLLPTSFLARAKVGGFINSYHAQAYLIVAVVLLLSRFVQGLGEAARGSILGALALAALPMLPFGRAWNSCRRLAEIPSNPQRAACEFARSHPREVYFPWFPLATLRAEGELYHFEWGIHDRELAGYPLGDEEIRAGLPARLRYVILEDRSRPDALARLPEFTQGAEVPELPGFKAYTR